MAQVRAAGVRQVLFGEYCWRTLIANSHSLADHLLPCHPSVYPAFLFFFIVSSVGFSFFSAKLWQRTIYHPAIHQPAIHHSNTHHPAIHHPSHATSSFTTLAIHPPPRHTLARPTGFSLAVAPSGRRSEAPVGAYMMHGTHSHGHTPL